MDETFGFGGVAWGGTTTTTPARWAGGQGV